MRHVSQPGLDLARKAGLICPDSGLRRSTLNPFESLGEVEPSDGVEKRANCVSGILIIQALKPDNYPLLTVRHSTRSEGGLVIHHWLGASSFGDIVHMNPTPEAENRVSYTERQEMMVQGGTMNEQPGTGEIDRLIAMATSLTPENPTRQVVVKNLDGVLETHRIALMNNELMLARVSPGRTMEDLADLASRKVEEAMASML